MSRQRHSASAGPSKSAWTADHYVLCGGTVPPSVGLPWAEESPLMDRPGTYSALRAGQILLPSSGPGNEQTRIWNSGHRMFSSGGGHGQDGAGGGSAGGSACSSTTLAHSASAPTGGLQALQDASPKTPRTFRGLCRRASVESMQVPEFHDSDDDFGDFLSGGFASASTSKENVALEKRPVVPSHFIAPEESGPEWKPAVGKNVMWQPTSEGLDRSKKILDALFDVRRAGKDAPQGEGEAKRPKKDPIEDAPLFRATLMDLKDTSDTLMKTANQLKDGSDPVVDLGGGRHPSAVIAMRTLMVVQKKMALVRAIEQRFLAFEAAHQRKEELLKDVSTGKREVPSEMQGVTAFLKKYIHSKGEPVDADKSDFSSFVKSFGMPAKHRIIIKLERLSNEANDWWTVETLQRAKANASADELKRLLAVCTGIGAKSSNNRDAGEIATILGDRLAEQALSTAESLKQKDAFAVSRSDVPQVESARKCAEQINANLKEAIKMGAPTSHPCMSSAKAIATELEVESRSRIAQKALVHAQMQKVRDENMQSVAGPDGIVEVGSASNLADSIDDAIKKALKEGAPNGHPALEEAKEIGKYLRDKDGERKRMKARAERLKKEAAAKAGAKG